MRKLQPLPTKKLYNNEFNIQDNIVFEKGAGIQTDFTTPVLSEMTEGETRIDTTNNRKVTKIDGKVYKEVVDENSEVKFEEIT